jgi:ribose-phosphate pyrophosphokinase
VSVRVIAQLFEAVGGDGLITLEAHNVAAFDNAFRRRAVNLEPYALFTAAAAKLVGDAPVVVASPDVGGVKRVQLWREWLQARQSREIGFAMIDKRRSAGVVTSGHLVAGEVAGATVLLQDDLIASGGTMADAARALRSAGARQVLACAAHGLFTGDAAATLAGAPISQVLVSDSVPPFRWPAGAALQPQVESALPLFAGAIRLSHEAWRR